MTAYPVCTRIHVYNVYIPRRVNAPPQHSSVDHPLEGSSLKCQGLAQVHLVDASRALSDTLAPWGWLQGSRQRSVGSVAWIQVLQMPGWYWTKIGTVRSLRLDTEDYCIICQSFLTTCSIFCVVVSVCVICGFVRQGWTRKGDYTRTRFFGSVAWPRSINKEGKTDQAGFQGYVRPRSSVSISSFSSLHVSILLVTACPQKSFLRKLSIELTLRLTQITHQA